MRLAMCQMSNAGSIERNLEKSLKSIAEAAENHAGRIITCPLTMAFTYLIPRLERSVSSCALTVIIRRASGQRR